MTAYRESKCDRESQVKKEFLSLYQDNEREIQRLQNEVDRWESLAAKTTRELGYGGRPGGEGKLEDAVEKIIETKDQLGRQLLRHVALRGKIGSVINSVPDERLRQLLRYRYIDGHKWEKIADELHLEYRWVLRMHGKAITQLTMESHPDAMVHCS